MWLRVEERDGKVIREIKERNKVGKLRIRKEKDRLAFKYAHVGYCRSAKKQVLWLRSIICTMITLEEIPVSIPGKNPQCSLLFGVKISH